MARFHGTIGYIRTEETSAGVFTRNVTEVSVKGKILYPSQRLQDGEKIISDLNIGNRFSFLADAYARENFNYIGYIEWNGTKWAVRTVEIRFPRLILSVDGVYNG